MPPPQASRSMAPADHGARPLGDAAWRRFAEGCSRLGLPPADAPRRAVIEALYGHLLGVNAWCNLTRITEPVAYLERHVLDSLTALADPAVADLPATARCLDLGAGAGYPGLPLALWTGRPWILVERRRRKADFLTAAAGLLPAPRPEVRRLDAREAPTHAPDLLAVADLVVARAVGETPAVLRIGAPLLVPGGRLVLYKGPAFTATGENRTRAQAERLGLRLLTSRRFRLCDGAEERILVSFRRET